MVYGFGIAELVDSFSSIFGVLLSILAIPVRPSLLCPIYLGYL